MKTKAFNVARDEAGLDLLSFVANHLGLSRSKAKSLLDRRAVFVNGRRVWIARHRLAANDRVGLAFDNEKANAKTVAEEIPVLYRDDDCLVVAKPAGMLTNEGVSVESLLKKRIAEYADLRAVHRLDRDTSGCLLMAGHERAREALIRSFRQRLIRKTYYALVWGHPRREQATLALPVDGEPAVSHIRTLDANRRAALLRVDIETGRTHQIRQHLRALDCPLIGDRQYGDASRDSRFDDAGRQMLHAARLVFPHPVAVRRVAVIAPMPIDLATAARRLGLNPNLACLQGLKQHAERNQVVGRD